MKTFNFLILTILLFIVLPIFTSSYVIATEVKVNQPKSMLVADAKINSSEKQEEEEEDDDDDGC